MSGAVHIVSSDSESDNDLHNNLSKSESDGIYDERLEKERKRRKLQIEIEMLNFEDKERKAPHNNARRRFKSKKIQKRTPKVLEKTKKRKRKHSVISPDSVNSSENTRNRLSVIDNVQPESKSILNPSKRAKVVQFDDTNKDDRTDNFRTARLRYNYDQCIQPTGH